MVSPVAMPRHQPLYFLVEITVAHSEGPTLRNDELVGLVGEAIGEVVGVGEAFCIRKGAGEAVYDVEASRLAPLEAAETRRLLQAASSWW